MYFGAGKGRRKEGNEARALASGGGGGEDCEGVTHFDVIPKENHMRCFEMRIANGPLSNEAGEGPDPGDAGELRRRLAEEARRKREAEAAERRQAKRRRKKLKEQKVEVAKATAEIFAIQEGLSRLADLLNLTEGDGERRAWVAEDIAQAAENMGREDIQNAARHLGEEQKAAEKRGKKAARYVCKYAVEVNSEIEAAARLAQVSEEYSERLKDIAYSTIFSINLSLLGSRQIIENLITSAELGLVPDISFGDVAQAIAEGGHFLVAPLLAPALMMWEMSCYERAVEQIKENAKQEQIRLEAEEVGRQIREAGERARDYHWNRDPGWIDFIGRYDSIA